MKTIDWIHTGKLLASAALVTLAVPAFAASTWNFSTCNGTASNQNATNSGNYGNSWSCSGTNGTNKVTASAWGGADVTGSTGFQAAYLSPQGGTGFGLATQYEGLGVSQPNHAVDNSPTNKTPDLVLLKFDTAVALGTVNIGWVGTGTTPDADFTLMAYKGATPTIQGKDATNLATGWALVENSSGSGTGDRAVNAGNVVSSWWLISAYSSSYGGGTLDTVSDYFKLLAVASKDITTSGKIPEPGSLALLGLGLLGLVSARRKARVV